MNRAQLALFLLALPFLLAVSWVVRLFDRVAARRVMLRGRTTEQQRVPKESGGKATINITRF